VAHFSAGVVSFITASHSKKFGLRASATQCDAMRCDAPTAYPAKFLHHPSNRRIFFSGGCRFTKRSELLDAVATNIGRIVAAG
jgi:hypothetical protein